MVVSYMAGFFLECCVTGRKTTTEQRIARL
jgi:hypothetical protein